MRSVLLPTCVYQRDDLRPPHIVVNHQVVPVAAIARFWSRLSLSATGVLLLPILANCSGGNRAAELPESSPHARYARALRDAGLAQSAMGREWLVAADSVLPAAHVIALPLMEMGYYDRGQARAVGWRFKVADGQRVSVEITERGQRAQIFGDLFRVTGDSAKPFEMAATAVTDSTQRAVLRYDAKDSLTMVLRVQPELLRGGTYEVTIRTDPVLGFPVAGRGNSAAQSFWGVDRDGGARAHQGVDIFAPRGTPVLAATDGRIASINPNNLGGNVIWQSDEHRDQRLYYAHLDRHAVVAGAYAKIGDTIGFVGNTGNARTTSPHLHFGIYRRGFGAIDPWPYVRRNTVAFAPVLADTSRVGTRVKIGARALLLRSAPNVRSDSVSVASLDMTARVVGAAARFYRIELEDGLAGYVPASAKLMPVHDSVGQTRP